MRSFPLEAEVEKRGCEVPKHKQKNSWKKVNEGQYRPFFFQLSFLSGLLTRVPELETELRLYSRSVALFQAHRKTSNRLHKIQRKSTLTLSSANLTLTLTYSYSRIRCSSHSVALILKSYLVKK